jgi:serine/threonine protein kinase
VSAPSPLLPGDPSHVDGYRIDGRLGEGGQGVVFLGTGPSGERVAVKRLRPGLTDEGTARSRMVKEVNAARQVAPFCTARVIDAKLDGPHPHVISEFIPGPSLQRRVQEGGPISGAELYRLAVGTATALAAIHQAGVVHRDFKPANVMLAGDGPKVIDFGIARDLSTETTVTSRVFGTPAYMSPEQVSGERTTTATDVFAWASTMVYAATGRAPFDAPHMAAVVMRISAAEADLTGVPPALAGVVRRCFRKNPAERPTAQQVVQLLLGHPLPDRDLSDPTSVLAEATQVAVSSSSLPPPVPVSSGMTVPRRPDEPTPQPVVGEAAWWAQPARAFRAEPPRPAPMSAEPPRPPMPGPPQPRKRRTGAVLAGVAALVLVGGGVAGAAVFWPEDDPGTGDRRGAVAGPTGGPSTGPSTDQANNPADNPAPSSADGTGTDDDGNSGPGNDEDDDLRIPNAFDGTWQGRVNQPRGAVTSWTATLVLGKGENVGAFRIAGSGDLDCRGVLAVREESSRILVLDAPVTDDPNGACAARGTVTLSRTGRDVALFTWVDASDDTNRANGLVRLAGD